MNAEREITVFVSSPGDVLPERETAQRVVARLAREFAAHFRLETVFWERRPLRATSHFQDQIPRAAEADVVVVVIWSKLGTVLPHPKFEGAISHEPVTGTVFEFEDALAAFGEHRRPDLLVYRKTKSVVEVDLDDEARVQQLIEDKKQVGCFFEDWFTGVGAAQFKRAFREFTDLDQFETLLTQHLRELLESRFQADPEPQRAPPPHWHQGSPYRGLEPFLVEHAEVFHGRTRARNELRELLIGLIQSHVPLLLVVGASGSGKSSLVQAGLVPDLQAPGMVDGVGLCRHAIVRPGAGGGIPVANLTRALLDPGALPELAGQGYGVGALESLLLDAPEHFTVPLKTALETAGADVGLLAHAQARLVLVVDQAEELFTHGISSADVEKFAAALGALLESGLVWTVITLRSDFLERFESAPPLRSLSENSERYMLRPPTEAEIEQMITGPALAAGLRFERDVSSGIDLSQEVRSAATRNPGGLPLLEFVLDELWKRRRDDRWLTYDAYWELDGLDGAIGRRAEEVVVEQPEEVQATFPVILRALVDVGGAESGTVAARTAPVDTFAPGSPERTLIDAMLSDGARLLVSDERGVRVAHEALLTHWPRAAAQIEADGAELQIRGRVELAEARWSEADEEQRVGLLLPSGVPLAEAQELLARRQEELPERLVEYIRASLDAQALETARLEWRQLDAERARLRALAARSSAKADQNELLARSVEAQPERVDRDQLVAVLNARAAAYRVRSSHFLREADSIRERLRTHYGSPASKTQAERQGVLFSVEALHSTRGDAAILHFGEAARPQFALIDGGDRPAHRILEERLDQLRRQWTLDRELVLELVLASHQDVQSVGGVHRLLENLAKAKDRGQEPLLVENLWFNNFLPVDAEKVIATDEPRRHPDRFALLAKGLGIPINDPFDYHVMARDEAAPRVALGEGATVTILGPSPKSIHKLYEKWRRDQRDRGTTFPSIIDQLGGRIVEGYSSPEVTLVEADANASTRGQPRPRPGRSRPELGRFTDMSPNNLGSIIAMFEFQGRRLLFPGDARGDHVLEGLQRGGYLRDGRTHVDLLKVPHYGSLRNVTTTFFERVTADHYLVFGMGIHGLPEPDLLDAVAAARGEEACVVYLIVPHDPRDRRRTREKLEHWSRAHAGGPMEVRFANDDDVSTVIDLLDPVDY